MKRWIMYMYTRYTTCIITFSMNTLCYNEEMNNILQLIRHIKYGDVYCLHIINCQYYCLNIIQLNHKSVRS